METRTDYLLKESFCKVAIEDFKKTNSVPAWLAGNWDLFTSITIRPNKFPPIISFNFDGESFEAIRKFGQLYEMVESLFKDEDI
jgi:hypothetical protein